MADIGAQMRVGALIMKSVSLFLASGRRASGPRRRAEGPGGGGARPARRRRPDMDASARNANKLPPKQLDQLRKKTHFTKNELEALYQMYRKVIASSQPARKAAMAIKSSSSGMNKSSSNVEGIDRTMFREILHTTFDLVIEETLAERVWSVWEGSAATTSTACLRLEPWLIGLSIFLKGTFHERLYFCFRVYDLNSDGYITKDEMFTLMRNSLLKQPGDEDPDEGVRELVELALKKLDADQDGKVSFEDYLKIVTGEPLLLEAFGQCFPGTAECTAFLDGLQQ